MGTLENTTWGKRLILAAMLATGVLIGSWQACHPRRHPDRRHPENRYSALGAGLSQIRPNMTRRDVEKIFSARQPGNQLSNRTLYSVPPAAVVEIRYDEQGGPWSGDNRVRKDGVNVVRVGDFAISLRGVRR